MKNVKKILAFTMAMLMALSCFAALSMGVFADEGDDTQTETPAPDLSVQWEYNFTKYNEDVSALLNANQATVTPLANSGYVTINGNTAEGTQDSWVRFTQNPTEVEPGKLAYAVIKYRANPGDATLCMSANTKDDEGVEKAGWVANMVTGALVRDGAWHTTVVDTTKWAVEGGTKVTDIRMDIGENMAGSVFDLAYVKFFASAEGAQACVDAEKVSKTVSGEYNEGDAKIVKIGDAYYSADVIISLTAKEGAEGTYVDADGAEYTLRGGYVIDANGKDTGLTLVTADNGVFAYSAYAFYPLTYVDPNAAAVEIEGVKYAYATKADATANLVPVAPDVTPGNKPAEGTYNYITVHNSCDDLRMNGSIIKGFESQAGVVLQKIGGKVYDIDKTAENIGFRGWIGDAGQAVKEMGYVINDGEAVFSTSFLEQTESSVQTAGGGPNSQRYHITIPTADLAEGIYFITLLVKYADDSVACINYTDAPNAAGAWGKDVWFVKGGSWAVGSYTVGADTYTLVDGALMKNGEAAPADTKLVTGDTNVLYTGLAELGEDSTGKYTYNAELNYVKTPAIPYNPATLVPDLLLDGKELVSAGTPVNMTAEYNVEEGYATYNATGDDPNAGNLFVGQMLPRFLVIQYRTTDATGAQSDGIFVSITPKLGGNHHIPTPWTGDGQWHTMMLDLTKSQEYSADAAIVHFRADLIQKDSSLDIAYYAFFSDELAAQTYIEEGLWTAPKYHTATFKADGETVKTVEFREGATSINAPKVPAKEGFDGKWAEYTLGTEDIVIEAIYTEKVVEPEDTNVPEDTGAADTGAVEDTGAADTGAADTEAAQGTEAVDGTEAGTSAEAGTTADTTATDDGGCASVVGLGAVAVLMAAAAAAVVLKKKED